MDNIRVTPKKAGPRRKRGLVLLNISSPADTRHPICFIMVMYLSVLQQLGWGDSRQVIIKALQTTKCFLPFLIAF
jgi:hypothetical protein